MKKVSHRHVTALFVWLVFLILSFAFTSWRIATVEERTNSGIEMQAFQLSEQLSSFLSVQKNFTSDVVSQLVDKMMNDKRILAVKVLKGEQLFYERHSGASSEKTIQSTSSIESEGGISGSVEVYLGLNSDFLQTIILQEMLFFVSFFLFDTACLLLYLLSLGDLPYFAAFLREMLSRCRKKTVALWGGAKTSDAAEPAQIKPSVSLKGAEENFFITGRLFRHTFFLAPDVMLRFVAEKNADGLIHIASLIEKTAPCIGAADLQKKAIRLQEAILFSPEEVFCLEVEACIQSLEQVLAELDT